MTDRDRLIELIADIQNDFEKWCVECAEDGHKDHQPLGEYLADKLLANGVIVPPCKVGDKTFLLLEKTSGGYDIVESECVYISENKYTKIYSMAFDCAEIGNTLEYHLADFEKWVFLTKEEAEAELRKRGKENG